MLVDPRRDYQAMSGMVFGPIPTVDAVAADIAELEQRLNSGSNPNGRQRRAETPHRFPLP
jgi:hypothetical protein